jgi:hypothetical protein
MFDLLEAIGGAFIAVCTTVGATIKFHAWWSDRSRDGLIASCKALADKDLETWAQNFGKSQLQRVHFARITGIDRLSGHHALIIANGELGESTSHWTEIRNARSFVEVVGGRIKIRRPNMKDAGVLALNVLACALCYFAIVGFAQFAIAPLQQIKDGTVDFWGVTKLFFVIAWTVVTFSFAVYFGSKPGHLIAAMLLRQRLFSARKRRHLPRRYAYPRPDPGDATGSA